MPRRSRRVLRERRAASAPHVTKRFRALPRRLAPTMLLPETRRSERPPVARIQVPEARDGDLSWRELGDCAGAGAMRHRSIRGGRARHASIGDRLIFDFDPDESSSGRSS
jgi:hypothetical protein